METSNSTSNPPTSEPNGASAEFVPDDFELNREYYLHGGHKKHPQKGRWIPAGVAETPPTQEDVDAFNKIMDDAAAQIECLPPDFAKNRRHYRFGEPKV